MFPEDTMPLQGTRFPKHSYSVTWLALMVLSAVLAFFVFIAALCQRRGGLDPARDWLKMFKIASAFFFHAVLLFIPTGPEVLPGLKEKEVAQILAVATLLDRFAVFSVSLTLAGVANGIAAAHSGRSETSQRSAYLTGFFGLILILVNTAIFIVAVIEASPVIELQQHMLIISTLAFVYLLSQLIFAVALLFRSALLVARAVSKPRLIRVGLPIHEMAIGCL
ncbi:hypothetical protein CDD83_428 [Cordyceps sp. RAO-2017]|nr:hypothetical protein CDD83_428 [Cordyceps sp. RAO-2017]